MKNYIIADGIALYALQKSLMEGEGASRIDFNQLFEVINQKYGIAEKSHSLFLYRGVGNDQKFVEKMSEVWTCLATETRNFITTEDFRDTNPTAQLSMLLGILVQQKDQKSITLVSCDPAILPVINLAKSVSRHEFRVVWPSVFTDKFMYMAKVRNIDTYQNLYRIERKYDKEKEVRQINAIQAFLE